MTLTDRQCAMPVLRQNVLMNNSSRSCQCDAASPWSSPSSSLSPSSSPTCNDTNIAVEVLDWGSDVTDRFADIDVVLGADIVYIEDTFALLLKTLVDVARSATTARCVTLLSCRVRYERDERFLNMLRSHFDVKQVFYDAARDVKIFEAVYIEKPPS